MADATKIEWAESTWNPTTGCSKVSAGCKHCYAERVFPRAYGADRAFTDVQLHPDRLHHPLRWQKSRRVFVNSMSDLFHESIPDDFIDKVFAVAALAQRHTFQILTKRPERMLEYLNARELDALDEGEAHARIFQAAEDLVGFGEADAILELGWPFPNVWIGVSVEDQKTADDRIPRLLQTSAAIRFVSYEPALGPVDFTSLPSFSGHGRYLDALEATCPGADIQYSLDWIIAGAESGPARRPAEVGWFRSAREQCRNTGTAFFMKQMMDDAGRKRTFESFPPDLQVREYPHAQG